ncbi:SHOCT domain-containing protein [Arenibacter algicola]|jgi:putative membrane protein|uniref:Membrane protein n=1 Tax=Arenibacter algicola TaxID=616991 RepID=A0A221UWX1_9FLAO|nr:SHOCT domain-containing protein [Arenibacter algicola]ASO05835.1 membrane protein [Arenibacter algicola]MDX1768603.1 SHOCT domain-containing protein [Arenibacter troitsensis]|tara:strand:- start:45 stop:200 length:156 start_codon:yes stop_codon:yes gene_type:complete
MMMYWWVIVLAVIVIGIFFYAGKNGKQMGKGESPMDILDNRFAKGEISKEE